MKHADLLGRSLEVGDHVAYPTQRNSSTYMCVAEILEIIEWERERRTSEYIGDDPSGRRQFKYGTVMETQWKVRLQPLFFTDYRSTDKWGYDDDGNYKKLAENIAPKPVVVEKIRNLVKVELPYGE